MRNYIHYRSRQNVSLNSSKCYTKRSIMSGSLTNLKALAYNIPMNLEDGTVRDKAIPELRPCS
jgi:hypothetical protein